MQTHKISTPSNFIISLCAPPRSIVGLISPSPDPIPNLIINQSKNASKAFLAVLLNFEFYNLLNSIVYSKLLLHFLISYRVFDNSYHLNM
jgi:hypothetical protein